MAAPSVVCLWGFSDRHHSEDVRYGSVYKTAVAGRWLLNHYFSGYSCIEEKSLRYTRLNIS